MLAAALVGVALAAGCGSGARDGPPGTLAWSSCGTLQCARLSVPLDHAEPAGEKIEISVVRRPAEDPARRIGALVMNPGGPGASGIEFVRDGGATYVDADTRARFDLIGFDPRGVGESAPVRCLPDNRRPAVHGAAAVQEARQEAATCVQKAGNALPQLSTVATARDLELLRAALGEEKLTYLGVSYGTVLGSTYADLFPGKVRAMVLDGPLDPTTWFEDRAGLDRLNAAGFQRALEAFFDGCRRNPRACSFGDGDPAAALDHLLARIAATPLPVPGSRVPLDRDEATAGIASALYDEQSWPFLGGALRKARDGEGSDLRMLAGLQTGRRTDDTRTNLLDAHQAVMCADADPPADPRTLAAELARLSPVFGGGTTIADADADVCRFWPRAAERYHPAAEVARGAPPILVVAATGDPATPLPGARAAAAQIHSAVLLTLDAWRHGSYGGDRSTCVDTAVARYLVDLVPPPPGTACPRQGH